MPSNPHKDLFLAIKEVFLPQYMMLHSGKIKEISKRDLCRVAFEKYPVSPRALIIHVEEYYVKAGLLSSAKDVYTKPSPSEDEHE